MISFLPFFSIIILANYSIYNNNSTIDYLFFKNDSKLEIKNLNYSTNYPNNHIHNLRASLYKTWTQYGPLIVNINNAVVIRNNVLVKAVNKGNQGFYLAFNCQYRLINITNKNAKWKGWQKPELEFEVRLFNDICSFEN